MRIDYKLNDKFDFTLFFTAIALVVIGLFAIYSSTVSNPLGKGNIEKQLFALGVGIVVFFVVYLLPTKFFRMITIPSYLFSIFLLVVVLIIGKSAGGAKSWIVFAGFSFQPSELAKLSTVMMLSHFLSKQNIDLENLKDIFIVLCLGLLPVALIMLEPDLGSSFVFFGMILILLFWSGISLFGMFVVLAPAFVSIASIFGFYYMLISILFVIALLIYFKKDIFLSGSILGFNIASGFFVDYVYDILSPHQQKRIQSFIDPMADPLGSGYNAIQAKVAIGSGGLWGKGFLSGNQTQLQFIPEQWTDFIYCVIGEEFGFVGSIIVLALFLFLFVRILRIASMAKENFLSMIIVGILSVYFIHFLINIGMAIGLMPVIGIPLPFISYGGSSLLVNMAMLGIVLNIYRTRKNYT
ncbi:MAG: rod shape-determining protein RodA [Ignavibacteria bacterium]|nr:rod shape-determining protein RodA [Ignavibacteria bacterium]